MNLPGFLPAVVRITVLLALVLTSTACSWLSSFGDDDEKLKPAELIKFQPSVDIKRLWSVSVGNGQGKKFNRLTPTLDGDRIYAAAASGDVMALDASNGRRIWRIDLDTELSGGAGVGAGLVLVGTIDGEVVALDQSTGAERWRRQLSSEILAPPAAAGNVVAVQTFDGNLFGLDASDGHETWRYETTVPILTLRGTAGPVIDEGQVFAAFANGKVVALDAGNGGTVWEVRVAAPQGQSEIGRIIDLDGTPLLVGGAVFAVSFQGRLAAIDRISGRTMWAVDASSFERVSEGLGNVFVADADGKIAAHDLGTGVVRWQQDQLLRRDLSSPQAFRSWLAVADFEGYVHLLSLLDGTMAGRVRVDSAGVRAPMTARGDVLYVFGNSGDLRAYRVSGK